MSEKPTPNFFQQNPERVMIVFFPLITLVLLVMGALLWFLATSFGR